MSLGDTHSVNLPGPFGGCSYTSMYPDCSRAQKSGLESQRRLEMVTLRIRVIRPVTSDVEDSVIEDQFRVFASPGTSIAAVRLMGCPEAIESRLDVAMAAPHVIRAVVEAERDGFDACIVNCFADPGVAAAREVAKIPVVGPGESSFALAATLGVKIGVVTAVKELIPVIIESVRSIGMICKLAAVRAVDIPVLKLENRSQVLDAFLHEALEAIKREGAHVIVAGCTGMVGLSSEVRAMLLKEGYDVPVIDPQGAAIAVAEGLVRLSSYHSRLTYSRPPHKIRNSDIPPLGHGEIDR